MSQVRKTPVAEESLLDIGVYIYQSSGSLEWGGEEFAKLQNLGLWFIRYRNSGGCSPIATHKRRTRISTNGSGVARRPRAKATSRSSRT